MQKLSFHVFYSLLWLITRLPVSWLYGFSRLCYPIIYYIVAYRKKVVLNNLRNSFPNWSERQVRKTARQFYRHFCDSFVETVAFTFLGEGEYLKRLSFKNTELINVLHKKGKSIVLLLAHYGNWELTSTCPLFVKHEVLAIYKPLKNKYFDNLFIRSRERFGVKAIPMDKTLRYITEAAKQGKKTMTYFLADQRPLKAQIQYWTKFLNQDTPVILGPEKIAVKFDMAAVYLRIRPLARGKYEAEFVLLAEDSGKTKKHEITNMYLKELEKTIHEGPAFWLWTHKRWKHALPDREMGWQRSDK